MGLKKDCYAKVWKIKPGKGNYTDVQISVSKKNKQTNEYVTDFSGFVRFCGTAHNQIGTIKEGDRIQIGDFEVTNNYSKEKNTTYTNFAVFSFSKPDGNNKPDTTKNSNGFMNIPDGIEEELPFN